MMCRVLGLAKMDARTTSRLRALMPGRPRKPTKIHILQGTAQKCRMAGRKGEVEIPAGMSTPPSWMPPGAQREWGRVLAISQYARALNDSHRGPLIAYCLLSDEIERAVEKDGSSISIQSARLSVYIGLAGKFGMTPSDQSKVHAPSEEKPANKFAKLG